MAKTAIFYATVSGSTKRVAELIAANLNSPDVYNLIDVDDIEIMLKYDLLILGSPTYGKGDFHYLWRETFDEMKLHNFQNTHFAIFCLGDQVYHSKTFAGSITQMHNTLTEHSTNILGFCKPTDYQFEDNPVLMVDQSFPGLILDETNQAQLTKIRVINWCNKLSDCFS